VDVLGHGLPPGSLARLTRLTRRLRRLFLGGRSEARLGVRVLVGRHLGRVGLGALPAPGIPGGPAIAVRVPPGVSVLG